MTPVEWTTIAVQLVVLGTAIWIIRSGRAEEAKEREILKADLKRLLECLHALELKLSNCVTWDALDKICSLERGKLDSLDKRVDDHETRITLVERERH